MTDPTQKPADVLPKTVTIWRKQDGTYGVSPTDCVTGIEHMNDIRCASLYDIRAPQSPPDTDRAEPSITLAALKALAEELREPAPTWGISTVIDNYNAGLTDLYEAAEKGRG